MEAPAPQPQITPNVVIENPKTRKTVYAIFGWVGLLLSAVVVADASSDAFNIAAFTVPAVAVWGLLSAGIGYTANKNVG